MRRDDCGIQKLGHPLRCEKNVFVSYPPQPGLSASRVRDLNWNRTPKLLPRRGCENQQHILCLEVARRLPLILGQANADGLGLAALDFKLVITTCDVPSFVEM